MSTVFELDRPIPMGISASSGRPLCELTDDTVKSTLNVPQESSPELLAAQQERVSTAKNSFALSGDFEASDLSQVGWGVIFAPDVDQKIKEALRPLFGT